MPHLSCTCPVPCALYFYCWIFPTLRALYFLYTAISFQSLSQPLSFQILPTLLCPSKTNKGPAHSCVRQCCPPLKTITDWEKFSLGCECTMKWSIALVGSCNQHLSSCRALEFVTLTLKQITCEYAVLRPVRIIASLTTLTSIAWSLWSSTEMEKS